MLCLSATLAACTDTGEFSAPDVSTPEAPTFALQAENEHFSFLSPLGGGTKSGTFNPRLAPVVEVCSLAGTTLPTSATACVDVVARYTLTAGPFGSKVTLDAKREMYSVNWNLAQFTLPTGFYRISVRTAPSTGRNTLLGATDIAVAPSSREARTLGGGALYSATATSDIPIKFRIEDGALCRISSDCYEGSVGPEGGTFVTTDIDGGASFPVGALWDTRNLVITRVDAADVPYCLPTHHPQYEGCFRFTLEPALEPGEAFLEEVVVGVCLDPIAHPFQEQLELQKWDEVDPASLTSLPRRDIDFLECPDAVASLSNAVVVNSIATRLSRFLEPVARLVMPTPLYAGTGSPFGGGLNDFSLIGWVRPLTIEPAAAAASACAETTIASSFRITSLLTGVPIAGVPVDFTILAGGGSVTPSTTASDANGFAATAFTLGSVAGTAELGAQGRNPLGGWPQWTDTPPVWGATSLEVTVTAPALLGAFLSPLGNGTAGTAAFVSGLAPVLEFCRVDASGACVGATTSYTGFVENTGSAVYQLNWTAPAMNPALLYRVAVTVNGRTIGSAIITSGDESKTGAGAPVYKVEPGRNIPVKVNVTQEPCTG